jgi:hypothetical protein
MHPLSNVPGTNSGAVTPCPSPYYVRHMQHFGILPEDLSPDAPIDPYAADRAYWESFWHRPTE